MYAFFYYLCFYLFKAKEDTKSVWVTLELRHDRVHQTYTKSILQHVNNMFIIGGDARIVVKKRFDDDCINYIFINHPEPPQQIGCSRATSQARHLLDMVRSVECLLEQFLTANINSFLYFRLILTSFD
jgi:Putative methyltransferase